jgi:hypothetical protein
MEKLMRVYGDTPNTFSIVTHDPPPQKPLGKPIPSNVQKMMNEEGIIFVATCNSFGIPNVSPRTAFIITDDGRLLWASWFKHKTYRNERENNHVSVAVVNSNTLTGYQMKGHVQHITEPSEATRRMLEMSQKPRHANFNKMVQSQLHDPPLIVQFVLEELYSLAPNESSLTPLA